MSLEQPFLDKIVLNGMQFYAYHGVSPEEKKLGSQFIVDVELHLELDLPSSTDAIADTVDYSRVFEIVKSIVEGDSKNLLEALCNTIAANILLSFAIVEAVMVRISKKNPPIESGILRSAGVELFLYR